MPEWTSSTCIGPGPRSISTWAATKQQAANKLGLLLQDKDVTNIPMLATDPYGEFIPGTHGLQQYVLKGGGLLEGNLANPVPVPRTCSTSTRRS
ncbi:MAG: hypothetical protein ABI873_01665 [Marmoricola sp.]